MNENLTKYLSVLFDPNESIWFHNCYKSRKRSKEQGEISNLNTRLPSNDGYFVGLNPAKGWLLSHGKENVGTLRNILIEIDDLSLKAQKSLIAQSGIPYSSLVFSGGKSIHLVISMEEPFLNEQAHLSYHEQIRFSLDNLPDPQTAKISTFTRLPYFLRSYNGSTREQTLIDLRTRVSKLELSEYLKPFSYEYRKHKGIQELKPENTEYNLEWKTKGEKRRKQLLEKYVQENKHTISGKHQYSLRCPSCAERNADKKGNNLSVNLRDYLLHCHNTAECDFESVMKALEEWAGLS